MRTCLHIRVDYIISRNDPPPLKAAGPAFFDSRRENYEALRGADAGPIPPCIRRQPPGLNTVPKRWEAIDITPLCPACGFTGIFYAAVYVRTASVWPVLIVHTLHDILALSASVHVPQSNRINMCNIATKAAI